MRFALGFTCDRWQRYRRRRARVGRAAPSRAPVFRNVAIMLLQGGREKVAALRVRDKIQKRCLAWAPSPRAAILPRDCRWDPAAVLRARRCCTANRTASPRLSACPCIRRSAPGRKSRSDRIAGAYSCPADFQTRRPPAAFRRAFGVSRSTSEASVTRCSVSPLAGAICTVGANPRPFFFEFLDHLRRQFVGRGMSRQTVRGRIQKSFEGFRIRRKIMNRVRDFLPRSKNRWQP